ncbi:MAG TPA: bifunctional riboflavin kinase/FAD synthetase [Polyangiaceae bacterium]|nr:bifunctional riboflavin kinase/FAD synthetase [Polyangiaceae bacterium]
MSAPRDALVVIGNFDGVHRGHQAVLEDVARTARERSLTPRMLTFEPHPAVTLGRLAPALLTTLDRKIELCKRHCPGIDVVVRTFTVEFSSQTPEEFVERVLIGELGAAAVMVGVNFRFGRRRSGGIGDLEELGKRWGFDTLAEPLMADSEGAWSSTRVRARIAQGDVEGAQQILGRPHMVSGIVAQGDKRGRQLGFPTCNLHDIREALPGLGVYAVLVDRVEEKRAVALARGVANLGLRPTVSPDQREPVLEVHLFDIDQDLYGAELRVHLVSRLRAEQRFPNLEALRTQIAADSALARERLASWEVDTVLGAWA